MNVQELIDKLQQIPDKTLGVIIADNGRIKSITQNRIQLPQQHLGNGAYDLAYRYQEAIVISAKENTGNTIRVYE
jgi:hypothetical protein